MTKGRLNNVSDYETMIGIWLFVTMKNALKNNKADNRHMTLPLLIKSVIYRDSCYDKLKQSPDKQIKVITGQTN